MSGMKNMLKDVIGLSRGEAATDVKTITESHELLKEALRSQHDSLLDVAKFINYADNQLKGITADLLLKTDKVDAFSNIKASQRNGVCYVQNFPDRVGYVIEVSEKIISIEQDMQRVANDLDYRHAVHNRHLFNKNERKIANITQSMKTHAGIFAQAVFYLQNSEQSNNKDPSLINKYFVQANTSLKQLLDDIHDVQKAFNHALKAAEDISHDDIRMQKALEDHLFFLKNGVYEEKPSEKKEKDEAHEALKAAMNKRGEEEVFMGKKGMQGTRLISVLHEYNKRKYEQEKDDEKELEHLRLRKMG